MLNPGVRQTLHKMRTMDTCLILVMVFIAIILLVYIVVRLRAIHITACGVEELRLIRDAKAASDAAHEETKILLQESRASASKQDADMARVNAGIKGVRAEFDEVLQKLNDLEEVGRNQGSATSEDLNLIRSRLSSISDRLRLVPLK